MPRTSRATRDVAPSEVTEGSPPAWKPETLHIATFNTLTMRRRGAYMACARQLQEQGIALLGLQEARPLANGTQTISCGAARYLVLSSAATSTGTHGCQLWVCLCSPWAGGELKHRISPSCVCILGSSPRFLLVRIKSTHCCGRFGGAWALSW